MWSTAFKIVLAWLPFYALWTLFVLSYADATVQGALKGSAVTISVAAALGMGIWWVAGRFPWPDRVRPGFYLLHAGLATLYSMAWFMCGAMVGIVTMSEEVDFRFWTWENIGWRFLMGVWLYGLVAGVSYALRIRRRLREQERAAARLEALATKAHLQSLQARLNPHFLFNALNSVVALIADEPKVAEDSVERLAGLLRYSLADVQGTVSLDQEWAFTLDYLEMEALRLGDRLTIETALAPETMACRLPPFALQALVENAIRHGVAPLPEGGTISVTSSLADGALLLEVVDDGAGASSAAASESDGTGLRDLRARLAGEYGAGAELGIDFDGGAGCRASLVVPQVDPPTVERPERDGRDE